MSPRVDPSAAMNNPFLRSFYDLGAWSDRNFGPLVSRSADGIGQTSAAAGKSYSTQPSWQKLELWTPYDSQYSEHLDAPAPRLQAPVWSRAFSFFGNTLDAASGVLNLAQTYKQDVDMGNPYGSINLIKSATGSVVQIGSGAYTGGLIAGGLAAVGAPAVLAIGLGAGAALGAGYLAGKVFDWGWSSIF